MKFMQSNLLSKSFILSSAVIFSLAATSFAQTTNPKTRRNSPFAPNPKGRTEIAKASDSELQNNTSAQKIVKIASSDAKNAELTKEPTEPVTASAENQNANTGGDGEGNVQTPVSGNPENPAVAEKDAETWKKAHALAAPSEIYRVGVGDILYVSLQNAPAKESTYFTVLKNGTIDYPLAGETISVGGLTPVEIETLLQEKIKLYENPQVSVTVREHNSHHYTVSGMVEKPGEKTLRREAYPLLVVRAEAVAQLKSDRAVIKRANSKVETVDLKDIKSDDILIYSGDAIEFTSAARIDPNFGKKFFYIGGEITNGGQKDFLAGMTLTQAILASGGLKKQSVKKIVIRRKNEAGMLTPTTYDLKAIKGGKSVDPEVMAGDTIEIGN